MELRRLVPQGRCPSCAESTSAGSLRELRWIRKAEFDLDAVRIDKVKHRADADIPDPRARHLAGVEPISPRPELLERFGDESEMIEASSRRVEPLRFVAHMLVQVQAVRTQHDERHAPQKGRAIAVARFAS